MKHFIKFCTTILLLISALSLGGCRNQEPPSHSSQIYALDTVIDLCAYGNSAQQAVTAAQKEIYRLENLLSVTNEQSDVYKLNNSGGKPVSISEEAYTLLNCAKTIWDTTDGKFDITIYPVLTLWGFTTKEYSVPDNTEITKALSSVSCDNIIISDNNTVQLLNNAKVDLGGIAKGYIADKAADAMKAAGADYGIISLGGNVRTVGIKPSGDNWRVGILYPNEADCFATLDTKDCSVVTSGAYQRNFTKDGNTYHHILDPNTGYPSDSDVLSVTVVGKDGALCDALSTALYIGGSEYARSLCNERDDFDYVILTKEQQVIASKGLKGRIALSEGFDLTEITYK